MAEGGDFGYDDHYLDHNIDHDDDDEQEVDRTQPFNPGQASTPYMVVSRWRCKIFSTSSPVCLLMMKPHLFYQFNKNLNNCGTL